MFRSRDDGAHWDTSGLAGQSVHDLAIPSAATNTVYAGVGDCRDRVYKSTSGGRAWKVINQGLEGACVVEQVVIDPHHALTVYVGTNCGGVYVSTNGGATWSARNNGLGPRRFCPSVYGLTIDPSSSSTLYASLGFGGLYKTTNAGGNWTKVSLPAAASSPGPIEVDPSSPKTIYVGTSGGLFRTTNGGKTWTNILAGSVAAVLFDPTSSSTIYAGLSTGGVQQSTDSGSHWETLGDGLTSPVTSLGIGTGRNSILYAGTEGGGVFQLTL